MQEKNPRWRMRDYNTFKSYLLREQLLKDKLSDLDSNLLQTSLERSFSGFSFVQLKLYNRLGNKKADKLKFLIKIFNKNKLFRI